MSKIKSQKQFFYILDNILPGTNISDKSIIDRNIYFERLSLKGLEEMHEYSTDERLYEYFEFEPFMTIKDTEKYLKRLINLEGNKIFGRTAIGWFVRRIKDKKMIGTARFVNIHFNRQSVEWGYGIDPELWGRGYIFEIQEILKEYVFNKLCLNRLWGITRLDNQRTISA